jgi:DNA-binding IclR family transcriptional regulator
VGKVFLAHMERTKALGILKERGLKAYTPNSITDMVRYVEELDTVARKGYAIDEGEYLMGVTAVAAPIRVSGIPQSALWSVAFSSGLVDSQRENLIDQVTATTYEIENNLRKEMLKGSPRPAFS